MLVQLVLFSTLLHTLHASRILFIASLVSKSHHVFNSVLRNELASRGHHVTYVSPYHDKVLPENIREVVLEGVVDEVAKGFDLIGMVNSMSVLDILKDLDDYSAITCELEFNTTGLKNFVKTSKKDDYDLIIVDFGLNDCMLGLLDLFPDTPVVGVTAFGGCLTTNSMTGNPESLAVKSSVLTMTHGQLNFWQRLNNFLVYLVTYFDRHYRQLPHEVEIAKKLIPNMSDIYKLIDRYELLLLNEHYSINPPVPTVPGLIQIAGLHIQPPKSLPQDIKKFLDDAKDGAVFFSLGTNVLSTNLGEEKIEILLDSFRQLAPLRILWKFESANLPNKPDNVMIRPWLPQSDILAHPNIKLFFTHSGLLSTLETIHRGVPILAMPFLLDQHINIAKCIADGFAEKVHYHTLNKVEIVSKIRRLIDQPKYKENVMRLSRLFRDQPQTPLQTAIFWIEYVIRHKGARHLRTPRLQLSWYQNELIDVVLFLILVVSIISYILSLFVKVLLRLLFGGKREKQKRH